MILYFYLVVSFLSPLMVWSQKGGTSTDSLRKYSYFIIGKLRNEKEHETLVIGATGFFYRINNVQYFFTAKHNLVPCSYCGEIDGTRPTDWSIIMNDKNGRLIQNKVDIKAKKLRDTTKCTIDYISPDAIALKINNPNLHLVDKSIQCYNFTTDKINNTTDTILVVGFPGYASISNRQMPKTPIKWVITNFSFGDLTTLRVCDNVRIIDTINYIIKLNSEKLDATKIPGFSGSPVFIKVGGTSNWLFLGLFSGFMETINCITVIKPEIFFQRASKISF